MGMDKLVYCRVCGSQIARSAKKCPKCGAKQKKGHGFRNLLLLVIIVCVVYFGFNKGIFDSFIPGASHRAQTTRYGSYGFSRQVSADIEETEAPAQTKTPKIESEEVEATEETVPTITSTPEPEPETETKPGVTPEFKAFMDSYEGFMNEYADFMENYDQTDLTQLPKYTSLITKALEFEEKADSYNEDNLSEEDYKYYIDVTSRINKRMVEVSFSLD